MDNKTNKAKLKFSNFGKSRLKRKAITFDKISRKLCLLWKFNKYTLTRVFLHAESISAMKTVQNTRVFMKMQK